MRLLGFCAKAAILTTWEESCRELKGKLLCLIILAIYGKDQLISIVVSSFDQNYWMRRRNYCEVLRSNTLLHSSLWRYYEGRIFISILKIIKQKSEKLHNFLSHTINTLGNLDLNLVLHNFKPQFFLLHSLKTDSDFISSICLLIHSFNRYFLLTCSHCSGHEDTSLG